MPSIAYSDLLAKLPVDELHRNLTAFLEPVTERLPDPRLRVVMRLLTQGIIVSQSPIITQMARGVSHMDETIRPTCKRGYRFLANPRFTHRTLLKGLYRVGQCAVAAQRPDHLVIAVDPVNMEKPYTRELEGVSHVMKETPPCLKHPKRITPGYPAITATIVNLTQPCTTYANWFSYTTAEFLTQNHEVKRAFRITRTLFPSEKLRFVGDAGLDDQKVFAPVEQVHAEFVFRACHERLQRWEAGALVNLVATVPFQFEQEVQFTHARRIRRVRTGFGWFKIRLLETSQELWVLVAHNFAAEHDLMLLTNVPLQNADTVRQVYSDWRQRGKIEHGYRFDQEDGLDVEDMRVETLEHMRRLFVLVLLAAQFVYYISRTWTSTAVRWLRNVGGKLGLKSDCDGPYVLLRGISAVWQSAATLTSAAHHPFPRDS
jgi:hypothetical protein